MELESQCSAFVLSSECGGLGLAGGHGPREPLDGAHTTDTGRAQTSRPPCAKAWLSK